MVTKVETWRYLYKIFKFCQADLKNKVSESLWVWVRVQQLIQEYLRSHPKIRISQWQRKSKWQMLSDQTTSIALLPADNLTNFSEKSSLLTLTAADALASFNASSLFLPITGAGAGKFWGCERCFARIFHNLLIINSHKLWNMKTFFFGEKEVRLLFSHTHWWDHSVGNKGVDIYVPEFSGFCPNFWQIKTFRCALAPPCTRSSYATVVHKNWLRTFQGKRKICYILW